MSVQIESLESLHVGMVDVDKMICDKLRQIMILLKISIPESLEKWVADNLYFKTGHDDDTFLAWLRKLITPDYCCVLLGESNDCKRVIKITVYDSELCANYGFVNSEIDQAFEQLAQAWKHFMKISIRRKNSSLSLSFSVA